MLLHDKQKGREAVNLASECAKAFTSLGTQQEEQVANFKTKQLILKTKACSLHGMLRGAAKIASMQSLASPSIRLLEK